MLCCHGARKRAGRAKSDGPSVRPPVRGCGHKMAALRGFCGHERRVVGTIVTTMSVVVRHLAVSGWRHVVDQGWNPVEVAPADQAVAVTTVVAACRGTGGFGDSLSAAGLARHLTATDGRRSRVWACHADGVAVGVAGLLTVRARAHDRWSIPFLVVAPDVRGRGVGRALVRAALAHAAAEGAETVAIETLAAWPSATAFWDRVAHHLASRSE